jgi:hypothetical protein
MGAIGDFSGSSVDYGSPTSSNLTFPPMTTSMYLWDVCKKGQLFQTEIYHKKLLIDFAENLTCKVFQKTVIPSRFDKMKVYEKLMRIKRTTFEESDLTKSVESVDSKNPESIGELAFESKTRGEKQLFNIIEFLKDDVFPPTMWMEYSRLKDVFAETMTVLIEKLKTVSMFKPQRKSQIKERNRFTKMFFAPFTALANSLLEVGFNFERFYLFMEFMSCEDESELFTEKLWTFKAEKYNDYEKVIFDFHNAITELEQNVYMAKPKNITVDFSKPIGWAFKQLVQTVKI